MMWKLISVLLGLTAFTVVCITSMLGGDELLTSTLKAMASFFVLWVFFSLIGAIFTRVVSNGDEDELMQSVFIETAEKTDRSEEKPVQSVERPSQSVDKDTVDKDTVPYVAGIDEANLPSLEARPEMGKAA